MIRPRPARWFEAIVARADAFLLLQALANAGCVQTEWHPGQSADASGRGADALKAHAALVRRFGRYLPAPILRGTLAQRDPAELLETATAATRRWARQAEPVIAQLQRLEARDRELVLAETALRELADSRIDFSQLARVNQGVAAALFALPAAAEVALPPDVLARTATVDTETLLLAVGPTESIERLARAVAEANGRRARFPGWLQPSARANLDLLARRRTALARRIAGQRAQLERLSDQHGLAAALGDILLATWCFEHAGAIDQGDPARGDVFARITGWTVDPQRLVAALESSGARALVSFPPPPRGAHPPLTLVNPWWARPFEVFTRLVGMPSSTGADPSVLLAFAVPLMFGYMFGDVGQGAVLIAVGLALRRRLPVLRLLVPAGMAAMAFGFVFGTVFCYEGVLIHPLWVEPLAAPLPVLFVPVVAGAVLLTIGLLLDALEAWWNHELPRWLREDAPLLAVYVGVLGGFLHPAGWLLAGAAAVWAAAAAAWHARARWQRATAQLKAAGAALGELLERSVQILINTVSFARVGAFALAHAGLSLAVVSLAHAVGNAVGMAIVLVLGNLLILLIEGLVVSIQTTRLVLFEFFTRFFRPEGHEFRPLAPPQFLTRP